MRNLLVERVHLWPGMRQQQMIHFYPLPELMFAEHITLRRLCIYAIGETTLPGTFDFLGHQALSNLSFGQELLTRDLNC
jgi:hypothetical protein